MSSFLCFVCHSTVNSHTNEETRDKYREVVGMHLCPDSHLCHVCCHMLNKLCLFKSMCLKRSLEYPVLFSEKGTINLLRGDLDILVICPEDSCKPTPFSTNKSLYSNLNSKMYTFRFEKQNNLFEPEQDCNTESNQYVDLLHDRQDFDHGMTNADDRNYLTNYELNKQGKDQYNYDNHFNEISNIYGNDFHDAANDEIDRTPPVINNVDLFDISQENTEIVEDNQVDNAEKDNEIGYNYESDNQQDIVAENSETDMNGIDGSKEDIDENSETDMNRYESKEDIDDTQEECSPAKDVELQNEETENTEETTTKKRKKKKMKKKSFEKIVLSFKEQKSVLEAQRKEKKYLEAEFKCHSCALGFLFKDTYQSHMVRHEESNGQFSCNVCGLRFATQSARYMHVTLHSEIHRCNKCGTEVKRSHRGRHRRGCWSVGTSASCHLCGKEFRDGNCLQQHLKRFHLSRSSNRTYSCNVCGKTYPDRAAVRTHMIAHLQRRFPCAACAASFTSPYTRRAHETTHARAHETTTHACTEDVHQCAHCGTSYSSAKGLRAHYRNAKAHQQTSYQCSLCPRAYSRPLPLRAHLAAHTAPRLACGVCGAAHSDARALRRHARRHEAGPAPVRVCHLCGKSFKGTSKLNRHLKEVCERSRLEEELAIYYEDDTTI